MFGNHLNKGTVLFNMQIDMKTKETLNYYNQNAETYIKQTEDIRTNDLCDQFVYRIIWAI